MPEVREHRFDDDGRIPNNPRLPLLIYAGVLHEPDDPSACESLFRENGWGGFWRDGVFSYHHYHSTAHEALGVVGGSARLALGGEGGIVVEVGAGDVVVIPAGVGHRNLGSSPDFLVVGAYPRGQSWDLRTGEPDERPEVLENIRNVSLPESDPVFGAGGPLIARWRE
ncbi:MAG: cupin domain-containing protein [Actinomycetota bacterium]